MFSLLEGRFDRIEEGIVLRIFNKLLLLRVSDPLFKLLPHNVSLLLEAGGLFFKLLPQIISLLLEKISLLHVNHQFPDIHFKRKPIVSV